METYETILRGNIPFPLTGNLKRPLPENLFPSMEGGRLPPLSRAVFAGGGEGVGLGRALQSFAILLYSSVVLQYLLPSPFSICSTNLRNHFQSRS